jgi:hypothetical protein
MNVIAPPEENSVRTLTKPDKRFLSKSLVSELRQIETLPDGRRVTKGQLLAERLIDIAINSNSNTDSIMASKLIFDRIEGRAAVLEHKEVQEMPKVVFACREDQLSTIAEKVNEDGSDSVLVKTDSGEEYIV